MLGFYDYTVFLTYLGFISSLYGIISAFTGHLYTAIFCLMFSGLCDMFDGKVARTKKRRTSEERNFGIQIDSLSDLVCFGVLPSVIGFNVGIRESFMLPILLFFPLAGLIRLAYFNVLEIDRNSKKPVKEYLGLPITSSALIFPFLFIFQKMLGEYFILLYGTSLLFVGILFITRIKVKKPNIKTMIGFILIGIIELLIIMAFKRTL